jgi:hypothetical protein
MDDASVQMDAYDVQDDWLSDWNEIMNRDS